MTEYKLEAKIRNEKGEKIRKNGLIPAIIYGKNFDSVKVSLDKMEFGRIFRNAGTSNLIDLSVDNEKSLKTLVQDIQVDPVALNVIHVDFLKVNMKEKIRTEVPLVFAGTSPAVVNLEGSLITSRDAVEVECLPADLIPEIEVDISILDDFEKSIRVADLKVPAAVEILDDLEEVIAHIEEPRSEEELEALSEEVVEDVSQVEVEAEKKEGEEGTEAATTEDTNKNK